MSHEIPISALRPSSLTSTTTIRGVTTLVWPFSESTQTCAILLAAEDVRLRAQRGQVRITFSGAAATAIAKSKAGISDKLRINLRGARWHETTNVRTPGRSVDGELGFKNVLDLTVVNSDGSTQHVFVQETSPDEAVAEDDSVRHDEPSTPSSLGHRMTSADMPLSTGKATFSSPAFLRKTHSSFNLTHDPFFDESDEEKPRKRVRISLGKVRDWRYTHQAPGPAREANVRENTTVDADKQADLISTSSRHKGFVAETRDDASTFAKAIIMQPPPRPQLRMPSDLAAQNRAPTTPKLQPVMGSTLPLPSPFPSETMQSPFDLVASSPPRDSRDGDGLGGVAPDWDEDDLVRPANCSAVLSQPVFYTNSASDLFTPPVTVTTQSDVAPITAPVDDKQSASEVLTPVDLSDREASRNQMLSSLFGFGSGPTTTSTPPVNEQPQAHSRTLSDFEVAETQAMEHISSLETSVKVDGAAVSLVVPDQATKDSEVFPPDSKLGNAHFQASVSHVDHSSAYLLNAGPRHTQNNLAEAEAHAYLSKAKEMTHIAQHVEEQLVEQPTSDLFPASTDAHSLSCDQRTTQNHISPHTRKYNAATASSTHRGLNEGASEQSNQVRNHQYDRPTAVFDGLDVEGVGIVSTTSVGVRAGESDLIIPPQMSARHPVAILPPALIVEQRTPISSRSGLQTSFSYFTALKRLKDHINIASQCTANQVDVIGWVLSSQDRPRRQRGMRGDFYLSLRIKDDTLPDTVSVEVKVYRPHEVVLPNVAPGDVILLRNFIVKSRNRKACLKSSDESAWCVWRYSELFNDPGGMAADGEENQPPGRRLPVEADVREEMRGPPVEYGDEEREEAKRLSRLSQSPPALRLSEELVDVTTQYQDLALPSHSA